jgi:hypothetical protein
MPTIAILEDDQRRITAIRAAAQTHLANHDIRVFLSAREMIAWLSSGTQDVRLISLDCDLDSTAAYDDNCGSGEDVTAFLACNVPDCSVLIHSSNAMRAPAMHMELAMAGCRRVILCPFRGSDSWVADVLGALAAD